MISGRREGGGGVELSSVPVLNGTALTTNGVLVFEYDMHSRYLR